MTPIATTSSRGDGALVHAALLYRHPDQLRAVVAEFVADAADAGEPVLAMLPAASLQLVSDLLDDTTADLSRRDMTDAGSNPARLLGLLEEWTAQKTGSAGAGRARVVSEPIWPGRSYAESTECLRHEALVNHTLAHAPLSLLCPYDAEHLDGEVLAGAELTHPELLDDLGRRPSMTYGDPLELGRGDRWPQAAPADPVAGHPFVGDLHALRDAVMRDPRLSALDARRREDLVFAVSEAATNAVRHGDGACETRLWRDGDRVVSEVRTATAIDDPLAGRRRPGPGAGAGRGLWLINQMCDLVELRSGPGGPSLRMHMRAA